MNIKPLFLMILYQASGSSNGSIIFLFFLIILAIILNFIFKKIKEKQIDQFQKDFGFTVSSFYKVCNPGNPMRDSEWQIFKAKHKKDYNHALYFCSKSYSSAFPNIKYNANAIIDIFENYQRYLDDAKYKNSHIEYLNTNFAYFCEKFNQVYDNKHYVSKSELEGLLKYCDDFIKSIDFSIHNNLNKYINDIDQIRYFYKICTSPGNEDFRKSHNEAFVKKELEDCKDYFNNLLQYPLDNQQREAVVNGEDNCLVVSSAGSGKTSTINAKVRYMIEKIGVKPEEILLISYTRKATEELKSRIGYMNLNCKTFHALAYSIIADVEDKAPSICEPGLAINAFKKILPNIIYKESLNYYFLNLLSLIKDPEMYTSSIEYYDDRRKFGILAFFPDMDGHDIYTKSEQERKICHFLSTHGINFRYEQPYEINTANKKVRQYKPDFTIYYKVNDEERHIYLEHFGINKYGQVPKWFGNTQNKSWEQACKDYNDGIKWKRALHKENGTVLIETTSAMFSDMSWESQLVEQLEENGVPIITEPADVTYNRIIEGDKHKESTIIDLLISFINLMKSNCRNLNEIREKADLYKDERTLYILDNILVPYYKEYEKLLNERNEIDFTDAILKAAHYCESGKYNFKYKYIIVDEFQDISFDRYKLLISLRNQQPLGKIFAVGDDWQSIYRFSGSDMGLFNEFEKHFGFTSICKIETTYRFGQPAIKVSSDFIQKNESQVKKNVKANNLKLRTDIIYKIYSSKEHLLESVLNEIRSIPRDKTLYIISRYSFDFSVFKFDSRFYFFERDKNIEIKVDGRQIKCLTVHQAKGLEADYIILLKCDQGIYGFPSMISDDPILDYVLTEQEESIEFAEERRVFYVAITRAKLKTTIFFRQLTPSIFVDEIAETIEEDDVAMKCPCCNYGHLKIRASGKTKTGDYYISLGCTNTVAGCNLFYSEYYKSEPDQEDRQYLLMHGHKDPHKRYFVEQKNIKIDPFNIG